jgi:hypothetical protein
MKKLMISITVLFLYSALSSMTLTYAGHAGKSSKSNDGIEFRPVFLRNVLLVWRMVGYLGRNLETEDLNRDDNGEIAGMTAPPQGGTSPQ